MPARPVWRDGGLGWIGSSRTNTVRAIAGACILSIPQTAGSETTGAADLYVERAGTGSAVVLVHGFSLDTSSWDDQFAALARSQTVLRYDLRGFGRSPEPVGAYSHVDDLAALIGGSGLQPVHLVGLSLGGNVALGCALQYPALVRSLVLVSAGMAGYRWAAPRPSEAARAVAASEGLEAARAFWRGHALFASVAGYPAAAAKLARIVGDYSGWHWLQEDRMRPFPAAADRLGEIRVPTLVAVGALDIEGYREIGGLLAEGIAGAKLHVFERAGHMLPMEVPAAFNALLGGFISEVEAQQGSASR